jgi:hypothetical protein
MKLFREESLSNFQFWSGAVCRANQLTDAEFDQLEFILSDLYPDGVDETTINDLFWFEFDWICECLGLELDEAGDVVRD